MTRTLVTAAVLTGLLFSGPARAQCPGDDGTVPGSPASVTMIGSSDAEPYRTIYVDDRDFFDFDDDGDAGGIWIYAESNGREGLQRGGFRATKPLFEALPRLPVIQPLALLPPDENRPAYPNGLALFPRGLDPNPGAWWYSDDCVEYDAEGNRVPPDTLIS